MPLRDYPRPADDTGIGIHWGTGDTRSADVEHYLPLLRDMGVKWAKILGKGSPDDIEACRLLASADIEPVVRLYKPRPHPWYVPTREYVQPYIDAGAHYFEGGNEPNLHYEWDSSWSQGSQPNRVGEQTLRAIESIKAACGIPMLPACSPGGHIYHETFFRSMLAHMNAVGGPLADTLDGCAVATHPRPLNHPPDYHQDTCAWLGYRWYETHLRDVWGVVIPQIATEHGYEPRWRQDTRFPEITRELHCDYNLELVRQVEAGEVGDAFFAGCFWHLAAAELGNNTFPWAAWLDSRYAEGGELPIVQALTDREKAVRCFTWHEEAPPEPETTDIVVGQGFNKAIPVIGEFRASEVWHWPQTPHETSMAVGENGYTTWAKASNETVVTVTAGPNAGEIWRDHGNDGDGTLKLVSRPSPL